MPASVRLPNSSSRWTSSGRRAAGRALAAISWATNCVLDGIAAYGAAMYLGFVAPIGEAEDHRDPAGPPSGRRP